MADVLRFTRLVGTDAGGSAFQDDELPLEEQWVAEGTPPMLAGILSTASSPVLYLRSSDFDSEPHPAPRPQWVVMLRGAIEVEVTDGSRRRFAAGNLLLLEDVSGRGHTTYTIGDPPYDGLFVPTGGIDYGRFEKRLALPEGFSAPPELRYDDVVATALTREHLRDDVAGINASLDLIRQTRGGSWPSEPTSEDANFVWLVWHELEFKEAKSFTYALYTAETRYLGCAYLYPLGRREPLTKQLAELDVDVSWWVTPSAYEQGYYEKVYDALRHWFAAEFPFWKPYFSNAEIPAGEPS